MTRSSLFRWLDSASLAELAAGRVPSFMRSGPDRSAGGSAPCTRNALGVASRNDLDLRAEGLRREAAVPPDAERALRAVQRHDPAQDLQAVFAGPHHAGSQELRRMLRLGEVHDRLIAVLLELALTERDHRSRRLGLRHARSATTPSAIRSPDALRWRGPADQCRSPFALSSAVIFSTAFSTSAGLRAPVQTTLPLPNMSRTTFGSSMRYTRPGNCSGSYSEPPRPRAIAVRFSSGPREVDATTFSIRNLAMGTPSGPARHDRRGWRRRHTSSALYTSVRPGTPPGRPNGPLPETAGRAIHASRPARSASIRCASELGAEMHQRP